MKTILAVETSCDDTSVAIVKQNGFVEFNQVINQNDIHKLYGGVVPELASRNHAHHLLPLIQKSLKTLSYTWKDIDCLAVTNRPGLVGSLIVGLVTVKTLSLLIQKPYIAVNHIVGHILSAFLWDSKLSQPTLEFPFVCLVVSGGHTSLFEVKNFGEYYTISKTVDDAAGEVLDKIARMLDLAYPSGAEIDKISQGIKLGKYVFPKPKFKKNNLSFSFSGLKTFTLQLIQKAEVKKNPKVISSICADFQEAVVEQLMDRLERVIKEGNFKSIVISGGVSSNSRLRSRAQNLANKLKVNLVLPPLRYCTDNAAMIGFASVYSLKKGDTSLLDSNCYPHSLSEDFI